jgi:hypothetical protein
MLKFFGIIFLLMFLVWPIMKWAIKLFIVSQVNKAQQTFTGQQRTNTSSSKKEGTIDVNYAPPRKNKPTENSGGLGDYVDYEEIKD